ncbi:RDD family protein [Kribbella antibiotica]|uniref:RDD family protein n=1 Tax=Kribbella antibiotica TaxID=190195 RepID=A0A4R4ZQ33_9ACTN|nr:RDD family protein [Kribbella antibiotica]TDD60276.1 RDD family protein [Kribbella antibiotica]
MAIDRTDPTKVLGRRLLHLVIDGLLVGTAALLLGAAVLLALTVGLAHWIDFGAAFVVGMVFCLAVALLGPLVNEVWIPHKSRAGASLGMRITGIRVIMLDGSKPPLKAFALRYVLMVVDGMLWGLVGIVVILRTPRRQRVGDLVAGTVVVRTGSVDEPVLPGPDGDLGAVPQPKLSLDAPQM